MDISQLTFFYWVGIAFSTIFLLIVAQIVVYPIICAISLFGVTVTALRTHAPHATSWGVLKSAGSHAQNCLMLFLISGVVPVHNDMFEWNGVFTFKIKENHAQKR